MTKKPKISRDSFIRDCGLSLRTQNVLYDNSETFGVTQNFPINDNNLKVSDIGKCSLKEIAWFRNCGEKTLLEIKELCKQTDVKLRREKI